MQPTPINSAEAILDPFWDTALSGFRHWRVTPGAGHGLSVKQNWCWLSFEWSRRPAQGPALSMTRQFDADCARYDKLLVSIMPPAGAVCRLIAQTDRGLRQVVAPPAGAIKTELALDLAGASRLIDLTIEIVASHDGIANGWFNWVGLQNTQALADHLEQFAHFDERWDGYIKPETYEPRFEPALGLLIDSADLSAMRARHDQALKTSGQTPYTRAAAAAAAISPESLISDFVNFWGDTRYCRERDHGRNILGSAAAHASNAALAGLLMRDKNMLRLAARYALSIAMCRRWDDGMICYFPGGPFDHRCFVQSLCTHECAAILDLAGEMLTSLGRDVLLRRIAEEGLGAINFNTWKYEYIFHCNQLAWFTPGRMLGYAVAERHWPRVKPYTEIAYTDLIESLGYAILPDGGYVEGPTYFRCVGRDGGLSLYYYARSRGLDLQSIVPDIMKRTGDFGEVVESTDEGRDVIAICDASTALDHDTLGFMAAALPQSAWTRIFRKAVARAGGLPNTILSLKLDASIPAQGPERRPFVFLPEMGVMTSTRKLGEHWVKLLLMGNKAGAGHTHQDKGSFVLEFAGQTFALDPGTCDYSSPLAGALQKCERHNMLVPIAEGAAPRPKCPLPMDVKPQGGGDATNFQASIDASAGWDHYRLWRRTWSSLTADRLIITDEYELAPANGDRAAATGVEFYWQTLLPVSINGRIITITGQRGIVTLTAPQDCDVRLDELPMHDGSMQNRIALIRRHVSGKLVVEVALRATV